MVLTTLSDQRLVYICRLVTLLDLTNDSGVISELQFLVFFLFLFVSKKKKTS